MASDHNISGISHISLATLQMRRAMPVAPAGYLNFNVTSMGKHEQLQIQIGDVSPYNLRDGAGQIFENIWQGSKVYPVVYPIKMVKYKKLYWEWGYETHVENNPQSPHFGQVNDLYWRWRTTVFANPYPLRYPNGREHRGECICSLWYDQDTQKWVSYDYITSRKKIYCRWYSMLVKTTLGYQQLAALVAAGYPVQFCETDVRSTTEVTKEILIRELHNTAAPFGHCYVLSACLRGWEDIWMDPS
jgi:hypothetical protein